MLETRAWSTIEPRRGKDGTKDGRNRAKTTREETEDSLGNLAPFFSH